MRTTATACLALSLFLTVTGCPSDDEETSPDGGPAGNGTVNIRDLPAGSFKGDNDLIGTWDVTLTDGEGNGDEPLDCTAVIKAGLSFVITCEEAPSEYDVDCEQTVDMLKVTGSLGAGGNILKVSEFDRYSGSACASYGLTVDKTEEDVQADADLTRTQAGVGSLGGKWMADFFDWDCAEQDESGNCVGERGRDEGDAVKCSFELASNGAIKATCTDTRHDEAGAAVDCKSVVSIEGAIAGGKLDVTLTEPPDVGSACEDVGDDSEETLSVVGERQ